MSLVVMRCCWKDSRRKHTWKIYCKFMLHCGRLHVQENETFPIIQIGMWRRPSLPVCGSHFQVLRPFWPYVRSLYELTVVSLVFTCSGLRFLRLHASWGRWSKFWRFPEVRKEASWRHAFMGQPLPTHTTLKQTLVISFYSCTSSTTFWNPVQEAYSFPNHTGLPSASFETWVTKPSNASWVSHRSVSGTLCLETSDHHYLFCFYF